MSFLMMMILMGQDDESGRSWFSSLDNALRLICIQFAGLVPSFKVRVTRIVSGFLLT